MHFSLILETLDCGAPHLSCPRPCVIASSTWPLSFQVQNLAIRSQQGATTSSSQTHSLQALSLKQSPISFQPSPLIKNPSHGAGGKGSWPDGPLDGSKKGESIVTEVRAINMSRSVTAVSGQPLSTPGMYPTLTLASFYRHRLDSYIRISWNWHHCTLGQLGMFAQMMESIRISTGYCDKGWVFLHSMVMLNILPLWLSNLVWNINHASSSLTNRAFLMPLLEHNYISTALYFQGYSIFNLASFSPEPDRRRPLRRFFYASMFGSISTSQMMLPVLLLPEFPAFGNLTLCLQ